MTATKYCAGCDRHKSVKAFHRNGDGLQSYCKKCSSAAGKKWRAEHKPPPPPPRQIGPLAEMSDDDFWARVKADTRARVSGF